VHITPCIYIEYTKYTPCRHRIKFKKGLLSPFTYRFIPIIYLFWIREV
jgi:hypothetical protein